MRLFLFGVVFFLGGAARGNPPVASYIFPAGGQRGAAVPVRVGGLFLHDQCRFALEGRGLTPSPHLKRTQPLWFEGPILPLPESQQQEDYPADMAGQVAIAKDAPLGPRRGWVSTSQGGAGGLVFVVGELPEAVERETDGAAIPQAVALPITANGRIFPRDDIDLWEFEAKAGQTVTALLAAKSLNSPLSPKLEVLDAGGRVLAETMTFPVPGSDESVRFTAPASGKYRIRVGDAKAQGGQAYVYRLTITAAAVPEYEFPLKVPADGLKEAFDASKIAAASVALNGRVEPGKASEWKVRLTKTTRYSGFTFFDLQARRFGSPLYGVVSIHDASGKELKRVEPGQDVSFAFEPPADSVYTVRVAERYRGRGGPNFVYRLRIADGFRGAAGFRLTVPGNNRQPVESPPDAITVLRGKSTNVRVNLERLGSFFSAVEVSAVNLPPGVTCKPVTIASQQTLGSVTLTFQADKDARLTSVPVSIIGTASAGTAHAAVFGAPTLIPKIYRVAATTAGNHLLPESSTFWLTVGLPTPFKIVDEFVMTSAPRGEVYRRKYRIERSPGFTGPIEVRLADRQARHLQGVTGPVLTVPPGQSTFEYPASLPPWMELGRTCRVCVMAIGKVKDADGSEHTVSFSDVGQNQQMIVVVGPGRLDVALEKSTVRCEPGATVRVPVKVIRARELTGPVQVDAVLPAHWKGVRVSPAIIPADRNTGEISVTFSQGECGPFNMPLVVRATLKTKETPIVAEAKLEVVK